MHLRSETSDKNTCENCTQSIKSDQTYSDKKVMNSTIPKFLDEKFVRNLNEKKYIHERTGHYKNKLNILTEKL